VKREDITTKKKTELLKVVNEELASSKEYGIFPIKRIPRTADFVMVYQEMFKRILKGEISLSAIKLFGYMISVMEFQNFIGIDLLTISEDIKMPLPTVKKAMHDLKELGIMISTKDNLDTRRNIYRLNPIVAWKGKVVNRVKQMKDNPAQLPLFANTEPNTEPPKKIQLQPNTEFHKQLSET
jgi:hypothetical protein